MAERRILDKFLALATRRRRSQGSSGPSLEPTIKASAFILGPATTLNDRPKSASSKVFRVDTVNKADQERQTVTQPQLQTILANVADRYTLLLALIAGTGLRIGEATGLRHCDFSNDCRVLNVQRSVWRGKPQLPKTKNAVRVVDVPDELAKVLCQLERQTDAYLFATRKGTPLVDRNVLKALHATGIKVGFHALRRYRTETLRRARVPEDLIRLWLGHASTSITDLYAEGLHGDEAWRRDWVERVGLGFLLIGLRGYTRNKKGPSVGAPKALVAA